MLAGFRDLVLPSMRELQDVWNSWLRASGRKNAIQEHVSHGMYGRFHE